jgi:pimeloyl-ACP methyl ester carboxylesterase
MTLRRRGRGRLVASVLLAAVMTGGPAIATAPGVGAQASPFERGACSARRRPHGSWAIRHLLHHSGWGRDQTKSFPGILTPTMMVAGQNDTIARPSSHAIPFYNSIPDSSEKAYLELAGAGHNASNSPNTIISKFGVSWVKRYIDNDTRYEQFICPGGGSGISQYRQTCPG